MVAEAEEVRFYQRRLAQELEGARRAVTQEAAQRRQALAAVFQQRLCDLGVSAAL